MIAMTDDEGARLLRGNAVGCKICVPSAWDEERTLQYAKRQFPRGAINEEWRLRSRAACPGRAGFVHFKLDAFSWPI